VVCGCSVWWIVSVLVGGVLVIGSWCLCLGVCVWLGVGWVCGCWGGGFLLWWGVWVVGCGLFFGVVGLWVVWIVCFCCVCVCGVSGVVLVLGLWWYVVWLVCGCVLWWVWCGVCVVWGWVCVCVVLLVCVCWGWVLVVGFVVCGVVG
jgi:hypothetical protein